MQTRIALFSLLPFVATVSYLPSLSVIYLLSLFVICLAVLSLRRAHCSLLCTVASPLSVAIISSMSCSRPRFVECFSSLFFCRWNLCAICFAVSLCFHFFTVFSTASFPGHLSLAMVSNQSFQRRPSSPFSHYCHFFLILPIFPSNFILHSM